MDIWSILQALLLSLAVVAMAVLGARMYALKMRPAGNLIRVLEVSHLGPGRYLLLVAVGEKVLLLGGSEKSLANLQTFSINEFGDALQGFHSKRAAGNSSFQDVLQRFLRP